jgi:hypothetical protein
MNWPPRQLRRMRLLQGDFDYNFVRASMVIIFFFFGYLVMPIRQWDEHRQDHDANASR